MKMQALQNMRPEYGPDCPKSAIDRKNNNDVTICRHYVIVEFFLRCGVSLVKFIFWSKFHVNTASRVIAIFFYKGLARNPEIGNAPV